MQRLLKISFLFFALILILNQSIAQNPLDYDCDLSLPSALTINQGPDSISFECPCEIIEMDFVLYNRWGNKVYSSDSMMSPFDFNAHERKKDGSYLLPAGVYYWNADYSVLVGDIVLELKRNGPITIVH